MDATDDVEPPRESYVDQLLLPTEDTELKRAMDASKSEMQRKEEEAMMKAIMQSYYDNRPETRMKRARERFLAKVESASKVCDSSATSSAGVDRSLTKGNRNR